MHNCCCVWRSASHNINIGLTIKLLSWVAKIETNILYVDCWHWIAPCLRVNLLDPNDSVPAGLPPPVKDWTRQQVVLVEGRYESYFPSYRAGDYRTLLADNWKSARALCLGISEQGKLMSTLRLTWTAGSWSHARVLCVGRHARDDGEFAFGKELSGRIVW